MTVVVRTRAELQAALGDGVRVMVPTMGALHAGHASLMRRARELAGREGQVVVSIFVNPRQFDQAADLAAYPVTVEADLQLAQSEGVDLVWCPSVADVYPPDEPVQECLPGPLGDDLEGASRPGHFAGMLTVVNLLLELVKPAYACFGEKDYQQLVLVRRLVRDRELPVEIVAVPTVRESDGLALSSRNRRLTARGRAQAVAIPRALTAASQGQGDAPARLSRAAAELVGLDVDYLTCRDPELGQPLSTGPARILLAAVIDGVRLIDNVSVQLDGPATAGTT